MLGNKNFNDETASFINRLSDAEHVDAGLLAFTFQHEGRFDPFVGPNSNGVEDRREWDWGPFQLNYNQTVADLNINSYSLTGLDIHLVFGDLGGLAGNTLLDPMQNGRLAARKLRYLLGASNNDYAVAAGRYRRWTGAEFTGRRDEWKQEGGQFQAFFQCFTKRE